MVLFTCTIVQYLQVIRQGWGGESKYPHIPYHLNDDDKLYLTTLTLSAEAGFHNGRVKNINKLLQVK